MIRRLIFRLGNLIAKFGIYIMNKATGPPILDNFCGDCCALLMQEPHHDWCKENNRS